MLKEVKQFAIARSSTGTIGLITSHEAVEHKYPDDNTKQVWTGVVIEDNTFSVERDGQVQLVEAKAGNFWSSSNPEVIGYIDPAQIADLLSAEERLDYQAFSKENRERSEEFQSIVA